MDLEAAQRRARWTAERSWTGERVREALIAAWAAQPRTTEHTAIMLWPTLHLPIQSELRMALHMMGLNAQNPDWTLAVLVEHRLNTTWKTYKKRRNEGCELIARALNGVDALGMAEAA